MSAITHLSSTATSNTALAAALSAVGIALAEKPFVRDGIRGERVVWFFEPQSSCGKHLTAELIAAWSDNAWHLANPEHPFAYIKAALMNREALVTKIKQGVPIACIRRHDKFAFLPLNASPQTQDLFLRQL